MCQGAGILDDPIIGAGLPGDAQQHKLSQSFSSDTLEGGVWLLPESCHEGLDDMVQLGRQLRQVDHCCCQACCHLCKANYASVVRLQTRDASGSHMGLSLTGNSQPHTQS